jgi:lysozyme family protein
MHEETTPMTIEEVVDGLLLREGSEFTDDPDDAGGPTKFGITQKTLSKWRGYNVTKKEVAELLEREARAILRYMYVERFDGIAYQPLRVFMADWHVHGGGPTKRMQELLHVPADGIIGPKTLAALALVNGMLLHQALWKQRMVYLATITRDRPRNAKFIVGWTNRMVKLLPPALPPPAILEE